MYQLRIFCETVNALLQSGVPLDLGVRSAHVPMRHVRMPTLQLLQAVLFFVQLSQGEPVFRDAFCDFFHVMATRAEKFDPFLISSTRKHGDQLLGILGRLARRCEHQKVSLALGDQVANPLHLIDAFRMVGQRPYSFTQRDRPTTA